MGRTESRQIVTQAIVLARTDFQEADRIITTLTPDHGKVKLIAKGSRRPRSKLAGGIELFSVSDVTYLASRNDIKTLVSSRLKVHYGDIVKDIKRTMFGYDVLKRLNRITEDAAGVEYYELLTKTIEGLNNAELDLLLLRLWFDMQLLVVAGYAPNLRTDTEGQPLEPGEEYIFDFDNSAFMQRAGAPFGAGHIKLLRLAYASDTPAVLAQVQNIQERGETCLRLVENLTKTHLHA